MSATLVSHVDTNLVTRDQLRTIPTPPATLTFKPVPHIKLVETLEQALAERSLKIEKEQFAVRGDGSALFSTFDLSATGMPGTCASLGLRTANNKTMSIQLVAGMRVFVCDNLALLGDFIALKRKHTAGLDLLEELRFAVVKYEQHFNTLKLEIDAFQKQAIEDEQAKLFIYDMFVQRNVMPMRFIGDVAKAYFEPPHADFEPRTLWSLHNAFTEVAKLMPMTTRLEATQRLGKYFHLQQKPPLTLDAVAA